MRAAYDPEVDPAYIHLTDEELMPGRDSVPCRSPGDPQGTVVLGWKDGRLVGIEVLDASTRLPGGLLASATRLGPQH